ncbi:glycoside hydrolase family protein [Clostridium paraputrificum]|uniref:glycoside hydrolase family protein n=1 Tax=Clostridium paraputrificum TaxID=29363 RepID=UPI003D329FF4
MKISNRGLDLIKEFEGCQLKAYRCPSNVLTIGWGHTGDVWEGQTITQEQADNLLKNDMVEYENYVNRCSDLTFTPNQNQFDSLVSFTYNCGPGNLKTLVQNRDSSTVADKLLLYVNGANGPLPGLVRRREAERKLFLDIDNKLIEVQKQQGNEWVIKLQNECNKQGFSNQRLDGLPGPNTLNGCPLIKRGSKGNITKLLQEKLGVNADGDFGPATEAAVNQFQKNNGLVADGVVGKNTWNKLIYM